MNALALSIHSPIVETHAKSKLVPCPVMRAGCQVESAEILLQSVMLGTDPILVRSSFSRATREI